MRLLELSVTDASHVEAVGLVFLPLNKSTLVVFVPAPLKPPDPKFPPTMILEF